MTDTSPLLEPLASELGRVLGARGELAATAESCTGGGVAHAITAIAGSSDWFDRGFVTYSNAAKVELLDVPECTLAAQGAVSEAVAAAMADGALRHSRAEWALAITGIAGPAGGSADKPVGTVCFAWASRAGIRHCETRHFAGDRAAVREQAAAHALRGLLNQIARAPAITA